MGFTPQVVDIDNDGILDIISGSYNGDISFYKGSNDGFEPNVYLEEDIDIRDNETQRKRFSEIAYTNPSFLDINGDGKIDAIFGGLGGPRYMLNIGTKDNPKFGERINFRYTNNEAIGSVDYKLHVNLFDYDNDGIMDLLTVDSNLYDANNSVLFYKGVKTKDGLRFEKAIPLFKNAPEGLKSIPGENLRLTIADINNDNIMDLIFGTTMSYCPEINEIDINDAYKFKYTKEYLERERKWTAELQAIGKTNPDYSNKFDEISRKYFPERYPDPSAPKYFNKGFIILFYGK